MTCKQGQLECIGNAQELCLYHHLPLSTFYPILSCLNFQSPFPDQIGHVDIVQQCVKAAKVDWWESGIGECIQGKKPKNPHKVIRNGELGEEARRRLLSSVKETANRGIEKSCTIEIESTLVKKRKRVCLVDDGVWIGCDVSYSHIEHDI